MGIICPSLDSGSFPSLLHTEAREAIAFPFLASMRLPSPSETVGSSGHERSPLEALPFTDGEIAGQRAEKRPQPTEQPHSGLYPYGGEPQPTDSREQLTPSRKRSSQRDDKRNINN